MRCCPAPTACPSASQPMRSPAPPRPPRRLPRGWRPGWSASTALPCPPRKPRSEGSRTAATVRKAALRACRLISTQSWYPPRSIPREPGLPLLLEGQRALLEVLGIDHQSLHAGFEVQRLAVALGRRGLELALGHRERDGRGLREASGKFGRLRRNLF